MEELIPLLKALYPHLSPALAAVVIFASYLIRAQTASTDARLTKLEKRCRELKLAVNTLRESHIMKYPKERGDIEPINGED